MTDTPKNKHDQFAFPEVEKARFREATLPVFREYLEQTFGEEGKEMLNAFLAAVNSAS